MEYNDSPNEEDRNVRRNSEERNDCVFKAGPDSASATNLTKLPRLPDAVIRRDRKQCKNLIESGDRDTDINQHYGMWKQTCLHIAVDQDDLKMCMLLLSKNASTDERDKWGRTPLHTAASKGNLRICEELLKAGALVDAVPVDATDKSNWTPLHIASSYGHRKICQLFISAGCDIHAKTSDGATALQYGCTNGHISVCRLMISAGSRIEDTNSLGRTALHSASRNAHSEICRLLINHGAEILSKDMEGQSPLDLWPTRKEQAESVNRAFGAGLKLRDYHHLMKAGSTPLQTVKLFLCGHPAVGKTSLKKALSRGRLKAQFGHLQSLRASKHCATPGIRVKEKYINGSGRFCVWDCAGHVEFHLTHSMFLGGDNGIFIIVHNVDKPYQENKEQISYWMSFIKAGHDPSKERKPIVVVVGTHLDMIDNKKAARGVTGRLFVELRTLFGEHLDICHETFLVESHRPYCGDMLDLRKTLRKLADPLRGEPTPRICDEIKLKKSSWCHGRYPVLYWKEMVKKAKAIDKLCEEELIDTAVDYLHDMGELHRAKIDGDQDIIILDPNWLTSAIFGPIFARTGLREGFRSLEEKQPYTIDDLAQHFELEDTSLLVQLLLYFELAQWYDAETEKVTIPAKLPDNLAPVVWENDPAYTCYVGRCLKCRDKTDMIAASVFPCLQVRLMRRFERKSYSPMLSRMAIKFAYKVEGMVQLSTDRSAILFAVRGKCQENEMLQNMKAQLEELTLLIYTILEQRSVGTQVVQQYLSPTDLSRSTDLEKNVHSYSEEDIKMAEEHGLPLVNPATNNTEAVANTIGPGYKSKTVPANLIRWRSSLRATLEQVCNNVVPSDLLLHLAEIIDTEEEQVITAKEKTEGPIRASRVMVDYLLRSTNVSWPQVFLAALESYGCRSLARLLTNQYEGLRRVSCITPSSYDIDQSIILS